jgi:iron-sulfur cluster repair protein YtfE (RIC family)
MPQPPTETWIQQVMEEHRQLKELLAELRAFLEQPRPEIGEDGAHPWAAELSKKLVSLHDELFRHFRYEEEGGMVEELSRNHPEQSRKIDEVVDEHPQILAEVRQLMAATLAYSVGQQPDDPSLRRRIIALLERLDRHERAETELIQSVEYQDVGAAD